MQTVMVTVSLETLRIQKLRVLPKEQAERAHRCQLAMNESADNGKAGVGGARGAKHRLDSREQHFHSPHRFHNFVDDTPKLPVHVGSTTSAGVAWRDSWVGVGALTGTYRGGDFG